MKVYKKIIALFVVISCLFSCQDLDKLNEDPNKVQDADAYLIMTNMLKSTFTMEGIGKEYATQMIVMTDGENAYQFYKWNRGGYGDYKSLLQVNKMIEQANKKGQDEYIGVGHFLRAYLFYNLTITFGDVPYSESLKGEEGIGFPKYNTQEEVLYNVLRELDIASEFIEKGNIMKGDIIYNGDINKWSKLIDSYKLKVLISMSKKDKVGDLDIVRKFNEIYAKGNLLQSNADNGQLRYYDQEGSRYPQFNSSSYGSGMYMSSTVIDILKERKDPRLFVFAQMTAKALEEGKEMNDFEGYNGGDSTVPYAENDLLVKAKNISKINSRYYMNATNEPHNLLSYAELQFILAEASVRKWITSDAEMHYNNGIKASFDFYNTYAKEYSKFFSEEAINKYLTGEAVKFVAGNEQNELEQVLTQKYLISFHQGRWTAYWDFVRTGFPKLKPQGNTPPTRWMYPTTEYNRNQENLTEAIGRQFGGNDNVRGITWWLK